MKKISFEIDDEIFEKIVKKKNEIGLDEEDWNNFFSILLGISVGKRTTNTIIEDVLQKNALNRYYNSWIRNFSLNLVNIWQGHSAKNLSSEEDPAATKSSAIVVGRGPSLIKHNHFEKLAKSNFQGSIVCTDGSLENALKAGITPEKFPKFYVVTIDTNDEIQKFYDNPTVLKYGEKIKCLLSTTVPQSTYNAIKKAKIEIFWMHTLFDYNKGKSSFNYISGRMTRSKTHHNGISAIQTGGNVGTSCWVISWSILKCNYIGLIGIDHGYSIDTPWETISKYHQMPEDIDKESKAFKRAYPKIYNPDFDCYCIQDPIFQYYSSALKEFIPKAPKWTKTINATEGGAIFGNGIECITLNEFLEKYNF